MNDLNDVLSKHDHGAEGRRTMNDHTESQPALVHTEQRLADFEVPRTADRQ